MNIILALQRISAPIVIFGGTAWIIVEKEFVEGLGYLILSFVLYIFLLMIEIAWIEHKHDRNIR